MEKVLSIIIPTYNMEQYLGRCLDSLLIDEIDKIQIIVVNDGSKDRSSEIAHSYEERFPNSIFVIDKPNGNYGSCINAGLKMAIGRYVKVLDSDDFFDKNGFTSFVKNLATVNSDAILTSYLRIEEDSMRKFSGKNLEEIGMPCDKDLSLEQVRRYLFYPLMHLVTYKLSILKQLSYVQSEGISYTDTEWCFMPFAMAKTFRVLPIVLYCYMIGREGQTVSPKAMAKSNPAFFRIIRRLIETIEQMKIELTTTQLAYLNDYLNNVYLTLALRIYNSHDESQCIAFRNFEESIQKDYKRYYTSFGNLTYNRRSSFKLINKWRLSQYSTNYRIPTYAKIQIKLISWISRFRRFISNKTFFSVIGK